MKRVLNSIRNLTQYSQDRFSDKELGKFLCMGITRDISETELLLNSLFNYFRATTAIKKAGTVNALIEEVLKENKPRLEEKGMLLSKKLEEDLPETIVPDEQLKYILDSVLQYVILSSPRDGSIHLLTESFSSEGKQGKRQAFFEKYGGYIEISIAFGEGRDPAGAAAALKRTRVPERGESLDLLLRLVKGIVLRNWGKMDSETDEKKEKRGISLRFPVERRRMVLPPPEGKPHPACVAPV